MLHVQCDGCRASAYIEDGADPDAAVSCPPGSGCCQEDHHHGQAANEAGMPCRPVTITVMPGSTSVQPAAGG